MKTRQAADTEGAPAARRLATGEFVDRFEGTARQLWCVAVSVLGDRALAEDVVQESAMIALQKLDQFDADTSFIAWMSRIVRFTALNHARRRQRIRNAELPTIEVDRLSADGLAPGASGVTPRGELMEADGAFHDDVLQALHTLDDNARASLLLRTVMNLPYADIARALDLPEGTVMSHVHRARRAMRERLSPHSRESENATDA